MTATTVPSTGLASAKALNAALWIAQVLLAIAFSFAGFMKVATPLDQLAQKMEWAASAGWLVRFIGASELAGAAGLLLPALTRIKPGLTALAGVGLAMVMALAAVFHLSRGEFGAIGANLMLGGLAVFVAWGRSGRAAIQARND